VTPRDRATLVREIQLLTSHIGGEFRPDTYDGRMLAPDVQIPEPEMISVATLRKLHRALEEFLSDAADDERELLLRELG
jgi:hypothetical protein